MHHCNGLNITLIYNFPLNSKVLVWRKSGNWTRPYRLLTVENKIYCVQLLSGLTSFKNTFIKPYFRSKDTRNAKLDELETPIKLNKLKTPLSTKKVP